MLNYNLLIKLIGTGPDDVDWKNDRGKKKNRGTGIHFRATVICLSRFEVITLE